MLNQKSMNMHRQRTNTKTKPNLAKVLKKIISKKAYQLLFVNE